jgi:hypothetical protein
VFISVHHFRIDIFWSFYSAFYSKHYSLLMVDFTTPSLSRDRAYLNYAMKNWMGTGMALGGMGSASIELLEATEGNHENLQ